MEKKEKLNPSNNNSQKWSVKSGANKKNVKKAEQNLI